MDVIAEPTDAELEYWDRLLEALESANAAERMDAETELWRSGVNAARVIYRLIGTKSEPVREKAACLLAEAGDAVLEPLGPLASAADSGGSRWAAAVLGKLKDERALPALTRALFVGNRTAGEILPDFGEAGADGICSYLNGLGHGLARAYLDGICSRDPDQSVDVWEVLIRIGEPAVRPLSTLLRHDHPGVVRAASEALLQIGGSAGEVVQAALCDSGIKERPTILGACKGHSEPWLVVPLSRLLGDSDGEMEFAASSLLQELDEEIVQAGTAAAEAGTLIPNLCRALGDDAEALSPPATSSGPTSDARGAAIFARRSAAAAVLKQFPTEVIRAELEREIDPALCRRLISVMGCGIESIAEPAFHVIRALGSLAADPVLQSLRYEIAHASYQDFTSDARATVLLWLLVQCGDPRVTELLLEALTPEPPSFRGSGFHSAAIKWLGETRDPRAAPALTAYLDYWHPLDLRLLAANALGQIGHRSALPALQRLLSFGLTWGDPVIKGNWVGRLLTTRVSTYETDPEVRAAVKQAISLIELTAPEIADRPIPAMPPSDLESSNLPRPVE